MLLQKGLLLPDARLSTVGGTSFAFSELRGRRFVVFGWGSWSPSAKKIAALQRWRERNGVALVTVAFDVTGPGAAMKVLKPAGADHILLIDATCTLTRRWGVRDLPFTLVVDEAGTVLLAGGAPDEKKIAAALRSKVGRGRPRPEPPGEETKRQFSVEILLQACTNFLGRKRHDDAAAALKKAAELDPENAIIRGQLRAISG
ncbi:MAG: TlpA family protein disulfide reductase [Planctomycetes bacterium]|nr:TlpA family protein disulfide reductase [Planctomycetota bacterium]